MYRVEDKFSCEEREMFFLKSRLQSVMERDGNQKKKEGYQITSVYFDDFWDTCLYESINGVRERCKYRIRIYDNDFQTIKLEIKYKKDSRVYKESENISFEQMKTLLQGECIEDRISPVINKVNLAIKTRKLEPVVIVEYDRTAFIYETGNVRITLDSNLRYSTNIRDFISGKKEEYRIVPETNRVIEVKYDEFLPGFISGILENGRMSQTAFSKYCICRRMELGYVNERCY